MRTPPSPLFVQAIGRAVPARALQQSDAVERMKIIYPEERTQRLLRRLARTTEIQKRHMAALDWQDGAAALPPLYRSATQTPRGPGFGERDARFHAVAAGLLTQAWDEVQASGAPAAGGARMLITVSCTHASSPSMELPLLERFADASSIQRWHLGFMGCSAGLAGLRLARSLSPDRQETIVAACELSSLHFQYTEDLDQLTANLLFADGAAIARLSAAGGPLRIDAAACVNLPAAAAQMCWFPDDHGLRLRLSPDLPDTLRATVADAVDSFLAAHDVQRRDIRHWAVHPGGPQILDAVIAALSLPPDALGTSRAILRDYGNMSSVTILFILERMIKSGGTGPGLAIAFGPGLTIELMLFELVG